MTYEEQLLLLTISQFVHEIFDTVEYIAQRRSELLEKIPAQDRTAIKPGENITKEFKNHEDYKNSFDYNLARVVSRKINDKRWRYKRNTLPETIICEKSSNFDSDFKKELNEFKTDIIDAVQYISRQRRELLKEVDIDAKDILYKASFFLNMKAFRAKGYGMEYELLWVISRLLREKPELL